MNPDSENFEQLRRLLALKRHEQPPPGYFNHFSRDVIARIKAGEQGEPVETGWLARLWAMLEAKPIFAGAFGAAVCAILVSGILNSEGPAVATQSVLPSVAQGQVALRDDSIALNQPTVGTVLGQTNPVTSLSSLFDVYPTATAQPVSWPIISDR
jgi:hypothetical protein